MLALRGVAGTGDDPQTETAPDAEEAAHACRSVDGNMEVGEIGLRRHFVGGVMKRNGLLDDPERRFDLGNERAEAKPQPSRGELAPQVSGRQLGDDQSKPEATSRSSASSESVRSICSASSALSVIVLEDLANGRRGMSTPEE